MPEDPKNPNAWWGVRIRFPRMTPDHWTKEQKLRLVWLIPMLVVMGSVEAFYLIKLMHSR